MIGEGERERGGERRGGKEEETRELGQQEGARLAWNSRFARSRKEGKG